MTNVFQASSEKQEIRGINAASRRPLILLGILCVALCAAYIASVRVVEASEYALRNAAGSRDNTIKQYGDLGRQLDSLRSLSIISQAPALAGFQEIQKPAYLNMDAAQQSVAVAGTVH